MTRRPPKARKRIDWEATRQRLKEVVVDPDTAREAATRILAERAARLAQVLDPEKEARTWLEVLAFERTGTRFALESRFVVEVGTCGRLSHVPGAQPALLGVTNLRGDLLPVFELSTLVAAGGTAQSSSTHLIVLGEGEPEFGVLADSVEEVKRLSVAGLSDARSVGALAHPEYVRGIGEDGRVLLDGHAIMRERRVFVAKPESSTASEREAS